MGRVQVGACSLCHHVVADPPRQRSAAWTHAVAPCRSLPQQGHVGHQSAVLESRSACRWPHLDGTQRKRGESLFIICTSHQPPRPVHEHQLHEPTHSLATPSLVVALAQYSHASSTELTPIVSHCVSLHQQVWAKPLADPPGSAAVVLFNRGGTVIGVQPEGAPPLPPHCSDSTHTPCLGCYLDADQPWTAPCDDNATASAGEQTVEVLFSGLPPSWLGLAGEAEASSDTTDISCDVFDVFATAKTGKALGRFTNRWSAVIPPHGVRFLRLSKCSTGPL